LGLYHYQGPSYTVVKFSWGQKYPISNAKVKLCSVKHRVFQNGKAWPTLVNRYGYYTCDAWTILTMWL